MSDREEDIKVGWSNPPTLEELQTDLASVVENQSSHIEKIDHWLDLLHIRNSEKKPKLEGRSNIQPKLIRKQIEWGLPSLAAPFLDSPDLFMVKGKLLL